MKNKALRIGLDIALILIGIVFLIFGIKDAIEMAKNSKITDNVLFSRDYKEISEDNIYDYIDSKELGQLLENGTGAILISKKSDAWTHVLVTPLNDLLKEKYDKIYYLDLDDEKVLSEESKNKLQEKLNIQNIPCITFIKDGSVQLALDKSDLIENNYDGAPVEYFTDERIDQLKEKLEKISE